MELLYVYVLHLEGDHYYVGSTKDPRSRIKQHVDGTGTVWTSIHKVLSVVSVNLAKHFLEEHCLTLEMMKEKGIDKVRGAEFSNPVLTKEQRTSIEKAICGARGACFTCGKTDHFSGKCRKDAVSKAPAPKRERYALERSWTDRFQTRDRALSTPKRERYALERSWTDCFQTRDQVISASPPDQLFGVVVEIMQRKHFFPDDKPLSLIYSHFDIGKKRSLSHDGLYLRSFTFGIVTSRLNLIIGKLHYPHNDLKPQNISREIVFDHVPAPELLEKAKAFRSNVSHHCKLLSEFKYFLSSF